MKIFHQYKFAVISSFLLSSTLSINASAQYCIGYTEYQIKRPNGKVLRSDRLDKLKFLSFDGAAREIARRNERTTVYYELEGKIRHHLIKTKDQISVIFGPCGQIRDMTLSYEGVRMKLLFNIGINNTNFLIRALPFQPGTFRLTSLRCRDSKGPPMIDNENFGFCEIPSKRWQKISKTADDVTETSVKSL